MKSCWALDLPNVILHSGYMNIHRYRIILTLKPRVRTIQTRMQEMLAPIANITAIKYNHSMTLPIIFINKKKRNTISKFLLRKWLNLKETDI